MDLATIKAGLDLAKAVKEWVPSNRDDHTVRQQICDALRTFYFMPRGIVLLLKKVDADERISEEELSQALLDFNDREPAVARASDHLLFERLIRERGLSLRAIQNLELVRAGKISLRRDIQREINYYGRGRTKPNKERVRLLLSEIDRLNTLIIEVEEAVRAHQR
ncbi:hypothetical protein XI03_28005 [Bradyrhizobium sp. CCBAU 65884]|uniref:hypothetical protein n=1 Tax=Bradyrhizobium sp. CCBAU 65884 TaxID=722477 RepID=UPI002304DEA2|nr:hypothetical protein [Bradyrhizobium sp. CCBAU 65884]MDA9478253.1 hypothetical protein [Bradyrhizobium sp. CCBAU 65884]